MITVAELVEKLMELPLDGTVAFWERRYNGGGDEDYTCRLAVVKMNGENHYVLTPKPDTEACEYNFGKKVMELEL